MGRIAPAIGDRRVLHLIGNYLRRGAMVDGLVEASVEGTPQGGPLSPLLANIYLHWFDHLFERGDGPAQWAKAKLVRYADDFVVLTRYISPQLRDWIEGKLEGWLGLQLNREKTRVLDLRQTGQSLDFLGYTFRYDRDQYGRGQRYWNLQPSAKARAREREAVRQLINPKQSYTPLPELIERLNRHLRGWANYFGLGYPRQTFRDLNHFVRCRLANTCTGAVSGAGASDRGLASTLTWSTWDWLRCERFLE